MFLRGDGTNNELRPAQKYVLEKIEQVWYKDTKPIVILGQTGLGKSMLAKCIQNQFRSVSITTPQNSLIKQYIEQYPDLNYWWGQEHFTCHKPDHHVDGCPYIVNRQKAIDGEATIFNPMSQYYLRRVNPSMPHSKVVVIDEAHAVLSMLYNLSTTEFTIDESYSKPQELQTSYKLEEYLEKKFQYAKEMFEVYDSTGEDGKARKFRSQMRKISPVLDGLQSEPECYSIKWEEEKIKVQCTNLPQRIIDNTFGVGRKVLMSGTIFKPDIIELLGTEDYHLIEPPAAIPAENRKIFHRPIEGFRINHKTDRAALGYFINRTISKYGKGHRTIIHLPYSWSEDIYMQLLGRPDGKPIFKHDKYNKAAVLKLFKETPNSVLIACGMAEGIDLKGDLCRLNIIPKILWPNTKDDFVLKKAGQGNKGKLWYELETAKVVIQQIGRSTRGPNDWSHTIILDPSFERMVKQVGRHLPKSFLDAIIFHKGKDIINDETRLEQIQAV